MMSRTLAVVVMSVVAWMVGCTSRAYTSSGDALADLVNPALHFKVRVDAIGPAREAAATSEGLRNATTLAMERIAWDPAEHPTLRAATIRTLLESEGETSVRAKEAARVRLPRERSREVVLTVCEAAAAGGWHDFEGPILRSYVKFVKGVEDKERAERAALVRLRPGVDIARIAFDVFVSSTSEDERWDAWDVADRLDTDGTKRRAWLHEVAGSNDEVVAAMAVAGRDLRAVPRSSKEVQWLMTIRRDAKSGAWWSAVTAAVAKVPAGTTLELRHAEAVRWAGVNKAEWLGRTRSELLEELRGRVRGREHFGRSVESQDRRPRERLDQVEERLGWGDVLQVLVLDTVVRGEGVAAALLRQAELDRKDTTTEYGGVLESPEAGAKVVLHMPRGSERGGDSTFVASPEMIGASTYGLAHYHFHAQNWRQQEYAGPSPQDLEYAKRYGRACLVFTAVREGQLAVDYYQPDGVVVDLGVIGGS